MFSGLHPKASRPFCKAAFTHDFVKNFRDAHCVADQWNSLINASLRSGESRQALTLYRKAQGTSHSLSVYTYVGLLKVCAKLKDVKVGSTIHTELVRKGVAKNDGFVGNILVHMYAQCGLLARAHEIFGNLKTRDVITWTALLAGYAHHQKGSKALECFEQMQLQGVAPNALTFACCLKACACIKAISRGQEIHADAESKGLLETNQIVGNAVVDMYAKCGMLVKAQEVFDMLPMHDVVSWNALISGYMENDCSEDVLICFKQMQSKGIVPNGVTFSCSLRACASIAAISEGEYLHAEINKVRLLEREPDLGSSLVAMYSKCGMLTKAQEVFDMLHARDVVTWTSLISGYVVNGHSEEALCCLDIMQLEGIAPDAFTFACILKACGSVGAAAKGERVHEEIGLKMVLKGDLGLGNALVDMYAKCGILKESREVFEALSIWDIASWNALISGYAQAGEIENVLFWFERMLNVGFEPNLITFVSILNACSHGGLIEMGYAFCQAMSVSYGIVPTHAHHTCMVDLLGRAGQVGVAVALLIRTPIHHDIVMWLTILGACRKWAEVDIAREAFEQAALVDGNEGAAYFCMYNIYADASMQEYDT